MKKSYTNLLQLFKNPIPIKVKKIQKQNMREIAAKQYKVQEYGHATRKLEKNKGIMPSKLIDRSKEKNKGIMPSKLIDRSKEKNKGIMPSKLIDRSKEKNKGIMPSKIGPPIIRWKEKKKRNKNIITYCTRLNIIVITLSELYSYYVIIL